MQQPPAGFVLDQPSPAPMGPTVVGTPRPAPAPSGYRPAGEGLAPIPGGPADPARNPPPSGYRPRADGGLEPIPGGPADPTSRPPRTRQLPVAMFNTLEHGSTGVRDLTRLTNTFNDNYTGFGAGVENWAQGQSLLPPMGTEGQNQWWSDLNATDNALRNALFGASLTAGEQQAWERTTVTPGMPAALIRANLARRQELAQELLRRRARTLRAGSYNEDQIREAMGDAATLLDDPHGQTADDVRAAVDHARGERSPGGGPPIVDDRAPPIGGPGAPPGGGPTITPGPGPGYENASSDAPPTREVTPHYIQVAGEMQAAFDDGASEQQMNELAQRRGFLPFEGPALARAIRYRDRGGRGARILPNDVETPAGAQAREIDQLQGQEGVGALLMHGATLGLGDEASGVGGSLYNVLSSPFTDAEFDPVGAYQVSRDAERIRLNEARDRTGWGGTAAELLGGFASGNPSSMVGAVGPTLGSRVAAGARTGAEVGALSGFGHGNGPGGSVQGALIDGTVGAFVGTAAPVIGSGVNALRDVSRTVAGRNPNLAQRTIANALVDDANTPRIVGQQMQEAQANGVPYMLADSGDNARGLLAASARAPGPGRTLARDALEQRQAGLGERVAGAVERDLGPASNPHAVNDALMERARAQAAPLYEQTYSRPGASGFARRISDLMQRPAMRSAMARARSIAEEEGRDPTSLGFDLNAAGEVTLTRTPSWQTMDYVKRGLDDVLQAQPRNPATGALILNEGTRAIQGTLRAFVSQFDKANPSYAAARAAWAGPVRAREAMDIGRRALNLNADDLAARTQSMSPNEMEFARLGVRRALVEAVAGKGDTANVVSTIIGTPKRRAMLANLFGGRREFDRFISTLQAEREGFRTFHRATQGSPTAQNVQDDANLSGTIATGMTDMATTGLPIGTIVKHAVQFGTSRAGRQAQQEIAALLSETDPARLMELSRELRKQSFRARARGRAAGRRATLYGGGTGNASGVASED